MGVRAQEDVVSATVPLNTTLPATRGGATPPPTATAALGSSDGDCSPRSMGWALEQGRLNGIGYAAAAVPLGRYIFILGGVHGVTRPTSITSYLRQHTSRSVNAYDAERQVVHLPRELHLNESSQYCGEEGLHDMEVEEGRATSSSGAAPPRLCCIDPSSIEPSVTLPWPVVGSRSAVEVGSSIYMFGCCNTIPELVYLSAWRQTQAHDEEDEDDADDETQGGGGGWLPFTRRHARAAKDTSGNPSEDVMAYLLSVQQIRLFQQRHAPTSDVTIYLTNWSLPEQMTMRFNASCVAGSDGLVYIVGGVNALSGRQLNSVAQYNITSREYVDAVWFMEEPVVNPAVAASSGLLFLSGGFSKEGTLFPSTRLHSEVAVMDASHRLFNPHVADYATEAAVEELGWLSPQLFIHGSRLFLLGASQEQSYQSVALWLNLSQSLKAAAAPKLLGGTMELLSTPFSPLRRDSVLFMAPVPLRDDRKTAIRAGVVVGDDPSDAAEEAVRFYVFGGRIPPPSGNDGVAALDIFSMKLLLCPLTTEAANVEENRTAPAAARRDGGERPPMLLGFSYVEVMDSSTPAKMKAADSLVPNQNTNNTVRVNGYQPIWYNVSFSMLLSKDAILEQCGSNGGYQYRNETPADPPSCELILSASSRCDAPLVRFDLSSPDVVEEVVVPTFDADGHVTGNQSVLSVGSVLLIGSLEAGLVQVLYRGGEAEASLLADTFLRRTFETEDAMPDSNDESSSDATNASQQLFFEQVFVHLCYSYRAGAVAGCGGNESTSSTARTRSSTCASRFFRPLNPPQPLLLSPMLWWRPNGTEPQPGPPPAPSYPLQPWQMACIGAVLLGLPIFIAAFFIGCRVVAPAAVGEDEDERLGLLEDRPGQNTNCNLVSAEEEATTVEGSLLRTAAQPRLLDGKYEVLRRLGRGSFSVVYLVRRVADQKTFALKYVQCFDDADRHEAIKECDVVHSLQGHPNIIQLYDMFMSYRFDGHAMPLADRSATPRTTTANGAAREGQGSGGAVVQLDSEYINAAMQTTQQSSSLSHQQRAVSRKGLMNGHGERYLSLVMTYHERGDLGQWVRQQKMLRQRISEATVVSIAVQVLSLLHFMHVRHQPPIIHRDLKPENILLNSHARFGNVSADFLPIVITDFGLSRIMDKAFCETGVGSLPYVAPECWQRRYSTKVDIWALGCVLYAVCTRRVEASEVKVMFSEAAKPGFTASLLQELTAVYRYSEALASFIVLLLAVAPDDRPTAAEALQLVCKRNTAGDEIAAPLFQLLHPPSTEATKDQGSDEEDHLPLLSDSSPSQHHDSVSSPAVPSSPTNQRTLDATAAAAQHDTEALAAYYEAVSSASAIADLFISSASIQLAAAQMASHPPRQNE